jgi:hypothetical protein
MNYKTMILSLLILPLTGCMSTLCSSKDPLKDGGNSLAPECVKFMTDKKIGYSDSALTYGPPILKTFETLKKTNNGFTYQYSTEILLGLVGNISETYEYDKTGKFTDITQTSGKFTYGAIFNTSYAKTNDAYLNSTTILGGLLLNENIVKDKKNKVIQRESNLFLDAFGYYTDNRTSYFTFLWVPIKFRKLRVE